MLVQHIGIGTLSKKEYFHTEMGLCFEVQGHYDSKLEHFC